MSGNPFVDLSHRINIVDPKTNQYHVTTRRIKVHIDDVIAWHDMFNNGKPYTIVLLSDKHELVLDLDWSIVNQRIVDAHRQREG